MHIAYLVNQYPKPSHTFIRREIQALEKIGIAIDRFSLRGWNEKLIDPADERERKVTTYVLQQPLHKLLLAAMRAILRSPSRFLSAARLVWHIGRTADRSLVAHAAYLIEACYLAQELTKSNAEHLHAHFGTNSATVAMLTNTLCGIGWSFTVHGPEEFDRARHIALGEKIKRATFVVAISSFGKSQLFRTVSHRHWQKIKVVRCGIDRDFAATTPGPAGSSTFLCVGRLSEQKGHFVLLQAARLLADEAVDFRIVLAGDGELRDEIVRFVRDHRLDAFVTMVGWVDSRRVAQELAAARALVLPSLAEGLPVSIMEAMALRRPAISTFIAGIPELVVPDINGWLVPAADPERLKEAMRDCLRCTPQRIASMGEAAYERVWQMHDIETEVAKLSAHLHDAKLRPPKQSL